MKLPSGKLGVFLVALSLLILAGCANTFSTLVRSKEEGEGTSRVYKVNVDQAWEIARRVSQWEGIGDISENRSEGYMLIKSGADWFYEGTLIGVWIEPIDKDQSKVTVITKSKRSVDTFRGISETDFHKGFALFVQGPDIGREIK
jgi:hypothetical protein